MMTEEYVVVGGGGGGGVVTQGEVGLAGHTGEELIVDANTFVGEEVVVDASGGESAHLNEIAAKGDSEQYGVYLGDNGVIVGGPGVTFEGGGTVIEEWGGFSKSSVRLGFSEHTTLNDLADGAPTLSRGSEAGRLRLEYLDERPPTPS